MPSIRVSSVSLGVAIEQLHLIQLKNRLVEIYSWFEYGLFQS